MGRIGVNGLVVSAQICRRLLLLPHDVLASHAISSGGLQVLSSLIPTVSQTSVDNLRNLYISITPVVSGSASVALHSCLLVLLSFLLQFTLIRSYGLASIFNSERIRIRLSHLKCVIKSRIHVLILLIHGIIKYFRFNLGCRISFRICCSFTHGSLIDQLLLNEVGMLIPAQGISIVKIRSFIFILYDLLIIKSSQGLRFLVMLAKGKGILLAFAWRAQRLFV